MHYYFDDLFGNYILILSLLSILKIVSSKFSQYIQTIHNELMQNDIQAELMTKSMGLDVEFFDTPEHMDAMQAVRVDSMIIPNIVWNTISGLSSCVAFVSAFVMLSNKNLYYAVLVTLSGIPFTYYNQKYAKDIYQWRLLHMSQERESAYIQSIASSKTFSFDIRLCGMKDFLIEKYKNVCTILVTGRKTLLKASSIIISVCAILPELCILAIASHIVYLIYSSDYTLGDYTLYTGLLSALTANLTVAITSISGIYEDKLRVENISKFLKRPKTVPDNGTNILEEIYSIKLRNVSFRYPNSNRYVIDNVSLNILAGERICLVGANGAGKTTLIKLLLRFYDVTSGEILINDKNIKEYTLSSLRNVFSTMFQQYDKLAFSLRDNIMLSDLSKSDEKGVDNSVIDALNRAGANSILKKANYNLDIPLSRIFDPHGMELSGGELQTIALARVLYRLRKVIIFDEPSAALDPISEVSLFNLLENYLADKTTIFTTHRMNTVHLATRIIVMENGSIIEDGSHDELMKKNGRYAHLFKIQADNFQYSVAKSNEENE